MAPVDAQAQAKAAPPFPWAAATLSPDRRADLVLARLSLEEKLQLVHGTGWGVLRAGSPIPPRSNLGAGFVEGFERFGIPDIDLADSSVGVRGAALQSRYATALPSARGAAARWDANAAYLYGDVIGRELRDMGFNMSIGGGVNLMREPRNGRNFEYAGEDPVLAGTMAGNLMRGVKANRVMSDIEHLAMNDQETGRSIVNAVADWKAMRESDLLAFQIAIDLAKPSAVMCAYNKVNGDYSCETIARTEADLPHPQIAGLQLATTGKRDADEAETVVAPQRVSKSFDAVYSEGARVGYKWFESEHRWPLFPFGFGLSYKRYVYSDLRLDAAAASVTFQVKNDGPVAGTEIAQVYAHLPPVAGERKSVTVPIDHSIYRRSM